MIRGGVEPRISASKRGRPQPERALEEITLTQAWHEWRERGVGRKALHEGVESGCLPHRRVARPGAQADGVLFNRDALREALAQCRCSFPRCENPAPGNSGRCGRHAARVKYETVELVCQHCGEAFTRPGSWLREREGRGHYCSNRCKGLAVDRSRLRDLSRVATDALRRKYAEMDAAVEERAPGWLTAEELAEATGSSPGVIKVHAGSPELPCDRIKIGRVVRLRFPPGAVDTYPRAWVRGDNWDRQRARFLDPDFAVRQQRRVVALLVERGLTEAQAVGATRAQVEARRRIFLPRRAGRKPATDAPGHHYEWFALFVEMKQEAGDEYTQGIEGGWLPLDTPPPSDRYVALLVAEEDRRRHPDRWDDLTFEADGSLSRGDENRAQMRVLYAQKRLQNR